MRTGTMRRERMYREKGEKDIKRRDKEDEMKGAKRREMRKKGQIEDRGKIE